MVTKIETFNIDSYFRTKTDNIVIDFYEPLKLQSLIFTNTDSPTLTL